MKQSDQSQIDAYLEKLRELPGINEVIFNRQSHSRMRKALEPVGFLTLVIKHRKMTFLVEIRSRVDYAVVDRIASLAGQLQDKKKLIMFAPYINPAMVQYLDQKKIDFIDLAGNARIDAGRDGYIFISGRKPMRPKRLTFGSRAQGVQVLFALLADPELVGRPIREIAVRCGISTSTVANRILALEHEGYIARVRKTRKLVNRHQLLEKWVYDYSGILEPSLTAGCFMTPFSDPVKREKFIGDKLKQEKIRWAWGGLTAAWILTRHYRDLSTVLFVESWSSDIAHKTKALQATSGHLHVLKSPGPLAFNGVKSQTVHPLLIYAQLVNSPDERTRETSREIFDLYIGEK